MEFLKNNLSTLILIGIAAIWLGISLGTDRCPSCVVAEIASSAVSSASPIAEVAEVDAKPRLNSWSAVDTLGHTVSSADLEGKVSVVTYWATWCGGCKKELPDLVALRNEFSETEVEIIGFSVDEAHKDLQAFAESKGINFRIARVNESVDSAFGHVDAIPTLFIIDQHGRIQFRHTGRISKDALTERVRNLLATAG